MLVDTGYLKPEAERVLAYLQQEHLSLKAVVITHHHIDHDQNMKLFTSICQTVYDSSNIGRGLLITIGSKTVSLFHTPGHFAKGDISAEVVEDRILIAGDILFSCLPSQLCYGSNPEVLKETIEKIASRHYRWIVPGHGRVMSGDALTDMTKNYIQKLESRLTFVVQNHGTVYDLAQIPLEDCISHFDWMVLEPSIDLHRQNKEELFEMLRCQIEKS